ncbi:hypothetical protein GF407_07735 [candidate division KSB1 bacterium]|nr:hypothetical protein [candidate division KSB1 bacterium]
MKATESIIILILLSVSMLSMAQKAEEQRYIIGSGDVLKITFWQDPELNVTTKVNENGMIALSVGGSIKAEGYTAEQLVDEIVERVSLFNRRITTTTVTVSEFGSRFVYVIGKVRTPGKYTFETIPNLWNIILEAGGPAPDANLSSITIIRKNQKKGETLTIDLSDILSNNALNALPEIKTGDNIFVPAIVGNASASGINALRNQDNVIFIYGQIGSPGVYTFNKSLNLLEALITAGGPTAQAKMSKVRVIRRIKGYSSVIRVNIDRYTEGDVPDLFMVKGGDTIYVPRKVEIRESFVWDFFMIAAAASITALVYNAISN